MKVETEVRLLDVNIEEFLSKLKACNAQFIGDWLQKRKVYDFTPVKENSWIRLRTNGEETTLTIKEIKDKSATGTYETEIKVDNFDVTNELLNKLGYYSRSTQENRRIRYMLDNVEIDVDFWPFIPTYVEFEGESEQAIKNVCKKLCVNYEELVSLDVSSIYEHYGLSTSQLEKELNGNIVLEENRRTKL